MKMRAITASVFVLSATVHAAEHVDLHQNPPALLGKSTIASADLRTTLAVGSNDDFKLVREVKENGKTYQRLQQTWHGVPVWGEQIIIVRDAQQRAVNLHGNVVRGIDMDELPSFC